MALPFLKYGDNQALLESHDQCIELQCGSHVDSVLANFPEGFRKCFVEYCIKQGVLYSESIQISKLVHLSEWLQTTCKQSSSTS